MSKILILQVFASLGSLLGIAVVFIALSNNQDTLAALGLGLFAVSLMVTPALKLMPNWGRSEEVADQS